jgi:hypothetical protein
MRSHITWIIFALGCVLSVIGLAHFGLSALQEPGPSKPAPRMLPRISLFAWRAATESLSGRSTQEPALKREVHITA